MKVLITGGTGFIGAHLVRALLRHGDEVTVLARPSSDPWRLENVLGQLHYVKADPLDPHAVAAALREAQPERIYLLAAATQLRGDAALADMDIALKSNVEPLRVLLDQIAGLETFPKSVVRTGTLAELSGDDSRSEEPAGIYGLSVLMGTHLLRIWRQFTGIPSVTARLSLTYGPDQSPDFFVPGSIRKALSGQPEAPHRPEARRDLLHVDDAISALRLISDNALALPPVLHVSTGESLRLGDVASAIARLTGGDFDAPLQGCRAADIVSSPASVELLSLGWRPQVPLQEGLRQVIASERELMKNGTTRRSA
ncbi:NAD-dependent epimerase/dehydratase family protein [Paracoccus sediminicola]|uniref:NAD-dependent epimerase/dehydratase family protein n=1 Tax=Paracoccus sediminicola TaxID=3017783 RepID=UPI0022F0F64A|nr:NAD(P)-dependent oxidoreductase [Paracoccus sediminicola]WBU58427.1 NAD(P)-dependent oxidoreductase [Paracoccus sediminicola]